MTLALWILGVAAVVHTGMLVVLWTDLSRRVEDKQRMRRYRHRSGG